MSKTIFLAAILISTALSADDDYFVPNQLLECAALFGWVSRKGTDNEKKLKAKEFLNMYFGAAKDLSSNKYALETFKIKLGQLENKIYSDPKDAPLYLQREISRCSDPVNLGDRVVSELNILLHNKGNSSSE